MFSVAASIPFAHMGHKNLAIIFSVSEAAVAAAANIKTSVI
jgi:hypothetical protein